MRPAKRQRGTTAGPGPRSSQEPVRRRVSTPYRGHPACRVWSPEEVAIHYDCSIKKVYVMLALGSLPGAIKLGKYWRIPIASVRQHFGV